MTSNFIKTKRASLRKWNVQLLFTIIITTVCNVIWKWYHKLLNLMELIVFFIRHWDLRIFIFVDFCFQIFDLDIKIIIIISNQLFQCTMSYGIQKFRIAFELSTAFCFK